VPILVGLGVGVAPSEQVITKDASLTLAELALVVLLISIVWLKFIGTTKFPKFPGVTVNCVTESMENV
jgi:hypothetical protein